jgi:hypothetical protein
VGLRRGQAKAAEVNGQDLLVQMSAGMLQAGLPHADTVLSVVQDLVINAASDHWVREVLDRRVPPSNPTEAALYAVFAAAQRASESGDKQAPLEVALLGALLVQALERGNTDDVNRS